MRRGAGWAVVVVVVAAMAVACGAGDEPATTGGESRGSSSQPQPATIGGVDCSNLPTATVIAGEPPPTALPTVPAQCVDPPPANEAERVRAELEGRMSAGDRRFLELSDADGVVHVGLRADGEELAAELTAQYGDVVAVTVGRFGYPGVVTQRQAGACTVPAGDPADEAIRTEIVVDTPPDQPGAWGSGSIRLHNDGPDPIQFTSGTATGTLVRDGRPVGAYEGAISLSGVAVDLPPGGDTTLPFLIGSASCDPALGYAVPPGTYDLVVAVPGRPGLVAGPVPLEIPARPTTSDRPHAPTAEALTPAQQATLYAAAVEQLALHDHSFGAGQPFPFPGILLLDHTQSHAGTPTTDWPGDDAPFATGVLDLLARQLTDVPLVDTISSADVVFAPGTPPTGGPAPLRPEAVVAVSPIRRDGDEYRIGGYLQFGPGGYSWAEYALTLDADHATITRTLSRAVT
jgi:hypothetical protein